MTAGYPGTGPYGMLRELRELNTVDLYTLNNVPIGPIRRKILEKTIQERRAKIKKILAQLKTSKR